MVAPGSQEDTRRPAGGFTAGLVGYQPSNFQPGLKVYGGGRWGAPGSRTRRRELGNPHLLSGAWGPDVRFLWLPQGTRHPK